MMRGRKALFAVAALAILVWPLLAAPPPEPSAATLVAADEPSQAALASPDHGRNPGYSGHNFYTCDGSEITTVFDINDYCLILRAYTNTSDEPTAVSWYDPQGNETVPCDWDGCLVKTYNYVGGVLWSIDFYFYISPMDRETGQYKVKGRDRYGDVLFTDYFTITFPYHLYLPLILKNY